MADRGLSIRRWRPGSLGVAVAVIALVAFPLLELIREVAGSTSARSVFDDQQVRAALWRTVGSSVAVTILTVLAAVAAVLVIERSPAPVRRLLRIGIVLPLLIPPFVSALSWVAAYAEGGLLYDLVGVGVPGLFGAGGVIAVISVNALPLAYVVVAVGLATRADRDLELAARASGAGPATVLRTVTLPALRPAIIGAAALVFVVAANSFGIPAVLGTPAGFTTVTTRIYQDLALSADAAAFERVVVLALVLVVLAGASMATADRPGGRRTPLHRVDTAGVFGPPRRSTNVAGAVVAVYVLVSTAIPVLALVLTAVTRAPGLAPTPGNWTLANFDEALGGRTAAALGTSVALAAVAATVVLALGALLVFAERRRPSSPLGTVAALSFAVPGSALAVAVVLAYGPWLRDTLAIIALAYVAKFWALGHRPLAGAARGLAPDLVHAARVSGAGPATATRTVVVPLLRPAIAVAWLVVFVFGLHELTMSSLLYGPDTATLAVVTLNLQQLGDPTVTAALAVFLTALVVIAAVPLGLVWRRWIGVRS